MSEAAALREVGSVRVACVQGDIAFQEDVDAVVNAANAQLRTGGGVAGALHRAAGPGLEAECRPLAPIRPGEAVITGGHQLLNAWVIHVLGPVHGVDEPSDRLLAEGHRAALARAEEHGITSVAFPAISTGAFGYPPAEAAPVAVGAVLERAPELRHVRLVRFVLLDAPTLGIYADALRASGP